MQDFKTCTKCSRQQLVSEFHKDKNAADGLTAHCKTCRTASHARYVERNREKVREQNRRSYAKNREKRQAYDAERQKVRGAAYNEKRRNASPEERAHRRAVQRAHRQANPEKYRQYDAKKNRKLDPKKKAEYTHAAWIKKNYGVTREQYQEMLSRQNGCCAICGNNPGKWRLSIDHCHKTGAVRALLCRACNGGIGLLKDDTSLLTKAIEYLNSYSS